MLSPTIRCLNLVLGPPPTPGSGTWRGRGGPGRGRWAMQSIALPALWLL